MPPPSGLHCHKRSTPSGRHPSHASAARTQPAHLHISAGPAAVQQGFSAAHSVPPRACNERATEQLQHQQRLCPLGGTQVLAACTGGRGARRPGKQVEPRLGRAATAAAVRRPQAGVLTCAVLRGRCNKAPIHMRLSDLAACRTPQLRQLELQRVVLLWRLLRLLLPAWRLWQASPGAFAGCCQATSRAAHRSRVCRARDCRCRLTRRRCCCWGCCCCSTSFCRRATEQCARHAAGAICIRCLRLQPMQQLAARATVCRQPRLRHATGLLRAGRCKMGDICMDIWPKSAAGRGRIQRGSTPRPCILCRGLAVCHAAEQQRG